MTFRDGVGLGVGLGLGLGVGGSASESMTVSLFGTGVGSVGDVGAVSDAVSDAVAGASIRCGDWRLAGVVPDTPVVVRCDFLWWFLGESRRVGTVARIGRGWRVRG
jgi:hypothetical protein